MFLPGSLHFDRIILLATQLSARSKKSIREEKKCQNTSCNSSLLDFELCGVTYIYMTILQVSFHLSYGFADRASQDIYQRTKDEFYNRWKDFDEKYDFSEVK